MDISVSLGHSRFGTMVSHRLLLWFGCVYRCGLCWMQNWQEKYQWDVLVSWRLPCFLGIQETTFSGTLHSRGRIRGCRKLWDPSTLDQALTLEFQCEIGLCSYFLWQYKCHKSYEESSILEQSILRSGTISWEIMWGRRTLNSSLFPLSPSLLIFLPNPWVMIDSPP